MGEHTPEQLAACERAMDGLEAQADIWADEISLVLIVKNLGALSRGLTDRMPKDVREGFINQQEAQIDALLRQAYLEGFYRGGESRRAYDEAKYNALVAAMDQLLDDMGKAGQSVCLAAKAQARVAFEPFRDKEEEPDWLMPLDAAKEILRQVDR